MASRADQSGWFVAHCDGGSRGNPGPAGFGAVIEDASGRVVARLSEFLGRQTNNYAEYAGLLAVLKWAHVNGVKCLRVVSDSELMVRQMKRVYRVSSPVLRPLWEEASQLAAQLDRFQITHTLRGHNQEADRLANQAMDGGTGKKANPTASPTGATAGRGPEPGGAPGRQGTDKTPPANAQRLEGYVKNGVIHILDGELPEGTFVTILRK